MSARVVDREARATRGQFSEFVNGLNAADISRMSTKMKRFEALFGTPYAGRADDPFRALLEQEGAVAERTASRSYWPDEP